MRNWNNNAFEALRQKGIAVENRTARPILTTEQRVSNFAQSMRYLRLSKNISQNELGKILGVSEKTVRNIEKRQCSVINFDMLCKLEDEFKVAFEQLQYASIPREKDDHKLFKIPDVRVKDGKVNASIASLYCDFARLYWSQEKFDEFCQSEKVDPCYFVNPNNLITMPFILRIHEALRMEGNMNYKKFALFADKDNVRLHANKTFISTSDRFAMLDDVINSAHIYERNQTFKIEDKALNHVDVSIQANECVEKFRDVYSSPTQGNYLTAWMHAFLGNITQLKCEILQDMYEINPLKDKTILRFTEPLRTYI